MSGTTILQIVKNFCYEAGIKPVPTTLLSVTDNNTLQIIYLLYAVHREIRGARSFPQSKRTYSFSTSNGVTKYQLPKDFYSALLNTQWNDTLNEELSPLTDAQMSYKLYGIGGSSSDTTYRIFGPDTNPNSAGGQFQIHPTPGSTAQTIYFDYISKNLFIPTDWLPSTVYTSGTYVNANGNIYLCDQNGTSSTTAPFATTQNITDGSTRWDYVSDPYETIIANTDTSLFDDDVIILGLKSKWRWSKGFDYAEAKKEYEDRLNDSATRHKGPFRGSFNRVYALPRYGPTTNGGWSF